MSTVVGAYLPFPVPCFEGQVTHGLQPEQAIDPTISSCCFQSWIWRYRATKLDLLRSTLQLDPTLLLIPKL